jgi:transcription elongation factor GreA
MSDTVHMTQDAYERMEAEVVELETGSRRELAERIKVAREWGDLKENSEYHDAKQSLALLEAKIAGMRARLRSAEIVEAASGGAVAGMESTVTYRDTVSGTTQTFRLVSANDAQPASGRLSIDSPVGKALSGCRVGDTAVVSTPRGDREFVIDSID